MPTPNLGLPFLVQGQAQKEITHNQALGLLDLLAQGAVLDRDLAAPPVTPDNGDRYLVAAAATDAWTGHDGELAAWVDGGWRFLSPKTGWRFYVVDEGLLIVFDGTGWAEIAGGSPEELQNLNLLGIGTMADATNRLSAKLNKALFTALTLAEGGDGSLLYTLNKEASGTDLGFLFQTDYVSKALIGLFGSDAFRLAVSADGSTFKDAFSIDTASGLVSFPSAPRFAAFINFDQYIAADTWLKLPINSALYNDQNAFDPANGRFTAPADGLYEFGAHIGWKQNASNVPTELKAKFVRNGGGTPEDLSAPLVSRPLAGVAPSGAELVLMPVAMSPLEAGDTVELQQLLVAEDGYAPATVTRFWGRIVG